MRVMLLECPSLGTKHDEPVSLSGTSTAVSLDCFLVGEEAAFSVFFFELLTQIRASQLKVQVCPNAPPPCFSSKVFYCQQK